MTKKISRSLIAVLMLIAVFAVSFLPVSNIAFADSEYKWGTSTNYKTADDLWYYGEDYINLEGLKSIIQSWHIESVSQENPIIVAVIDTGLDNHNKVFEDVLVKNSNDQICGYNSYWGSQGVKSGDEHLGDISDKHSSHHGTCVASIIAMMIKELHLENYIKIYPIKASAPSKNTFSIDSITHAVNWANSDKISADIINMSFGLFKSDMEKVDWVHDVKLNDAIREASQNAVLVGAAGNAKDGKHPSDSSVDPFYPASFSSVLSVMAYNEDGDLHSSSNYGEYDLVAPGKDIWTATESSSYSASNFKSSNGTSMAAPFVSMAAALLQLRFKAELANKNSQINKMPSPNAISRMLKYQNYSNIPFKSYNLKVLDIDTALTASFNENLYKFSDPIGVYIKDKTGLIDSVTKDYVARIDNAQTLKLEANLMPVGDTDPELNGLIKWILIDQNGESVIATGKKLSYKPDKGGTFTIKAVLNYGKDVFYDQIGLDISYKEFSAGSSKITFEKDADKDVDEVKSSALMYTTEKISLSMTGIEYCNPNIDISWFVNGQKTAIGKTFEFKPKSAGDYRISAKFGDNEIAYDYNFKVTVKSFVERPVDIAAITLSCVVVCGVIAVLIAIIVLRKKENKINQQK